MKKIKSIIIVFVLLFGISKAQNIVSSQSSIIKLTKEQKGFLVNTWYESPSESSANTIVYRLTEYVVIAGKDMSPFPPSKITINKANTFSGEYIKTSTQTSPLQTLSGNWNLDKNNLLLNAGNQKNKMSILSIEKDKMVVLID